MIALTKLDGSPIHVNAELIQYVEAGGDTRLTLTTGARLIVRERPETIVERVVWYRQQVFAGSAQPAPAFQGMRDAGE